MAQDGFSPEQGLSQPDAQNSKGRGMLASMRNISGALERGQDKFTSIKLVDKLSNNIHLLTEATKDPTSENFITSLDIMRNFFRYYDKTRLIFQGLGDEYRESYLEEHKNVDRFADLGVAFLQDNMQRMHSKMQSSSDVSDKALVIEVVSDVARFGKDTQVTQSVDFLLDHFKQVLPELKPMYSSRKGPPIRDSKETFSPLATIFDKGNSEQSKTAIQTVMQFFRSNDVLMKKIICERVILGIEDKVLAKKIMANILEEYNLNGEEMVRNWENTMSGEIWIQAMNLERLIDLEFRAPGIGAVLSSEFGISDFVRYPEDLLIAQYNDRDKKDDMPYGVVMYPIEDPNGAFLNYGKRTEFDKLFNQLKGKYRLRVWEIKNQLSLVGALNESRQRYGKISFALIGGHGTKDSITFGGSQIRRSVLQTEHIKRKGASALSLAFVENPTIILNSCSTGQLGGIAQEMSKIGAKIIAPDISTMIADIDVKIESGKKIEFNVAYGPYVTPNVYASGKPEENISKNS